ncbi:hypothetical protein GOBAR_AA29895 [Gossypium barbadense]|uniref:Uncharacterized protein n=1 Tax=Gossypium barbadense TaxID=3634 RepID=A0A2P5WI77_GOSBA|nr:hypothetical protein GOBAR_AA29895 [Gossypium barbadense]
MMVTWWSKRGACDKVGERGKRERKEKKGLRGRWGYCSCAWVCDEREADGQVIGRRGVVAARVRRVGEEEKIKKKIRD